MLYFLFDFLSGSCVGRMAIAGVCSFLLTILCGKRVIHKLYEWKIGDQVRTEHCPLLGQLHQKKSDTPTMGGVLILFASLVSLFLWMDLRSPFTLILFLTTIVTGCLGGVDDYLKLRYKNKKGMPAKMKLLLQLLLSGAIALYLLWTPFTASLQKGAWFTPPQAEEALSLSESAHLATHDYARRLYLPFLKRPLFSLEGVALLGMAFLMIFVITGASNAVNLTDGLDGLAAGTVVLASSAFALIAFFSSQRELASSLNLLYIEGSAEIAVYLAAIAGAAIGFLWYNGHPAQVFMGDTGSLALGAILGVSAVLLKKELLLGIIGGVFVIEALSVILQVGSYKLRNKKRIFLIAPLHHHFEYKGLSETKVVMRFWIAGFVFALVGILSLKFP